MITKDPVITFIISSSKYQNNLEKTLEEIIAHSNKNEHVTMHHWTDSYWYIEVCDMAKLSSAKDANERIAARRFALTVNAATGHIRWNYQGGNCWVRGQRWLRFFKSQFADEYADNPEIDLKHGRKTLEHKHFHLYGFKR